LSPADATCLDALDGLGVVTAGRIALKARLTTPP
jgi:hypothetical protein